MKRVVGAGTLALVALAHGESNATGRARWSCADSLAVAIEPRAPVPGALFRVLVEQTEALGVRPEGEVAGQPLHFVPRGGGAVSFAALPIDAESSSVTLRVRCMPGEQTDTVRVRVVPARTSYPVERLRVSPAFSRAPDSALASRIRRESDRARQVAEASHATPALWEGAWRLPRASRITSGFGRGREFNGTITSRHMGTDFAGATGAAVRAVNRGVVRIVDRFYYGGNVVYVDHGSGLTSAYLHLSRQDVAVGDTVARGAILGAVGATGRVTGPHLHLIVRYGTVTVNPMSLFALAGDSLARRAAARGTGVGTGTGAGRGAQR
ncbi:MAG: M23 family metallopeptidase [Gemmatimonadaceae bacterium]|nr:M23 family metallopeptidase [Gemmatimonadaceae bacterium]